METWPSNSGGLTIELTGRTNIYDPRTMQDSYSTYSMMIIKARDGNASDQWVCLRAWPPVTTTTTTKRKSPSGAILLNMIFLMSPLRCSCCSIMQHLDSLLHNSWLLCRKHHLPVVRYQAAVLLGAWFHTASWFKKMSWGMKQTLLPYVQPMIFISYSSYDNFCRNFLDSWGRSGLSTVHLKLGHWTIVRHLMTPNIVHTGYEVGTLK